MTKAPTAMAGASQPVEKPGCALSGNRVLGAYNAETVKTREKKMVLPFPNRQLFQIHGNKLKLHPVRHLSQASVLCITHTKKPLPLPKTVQP
jgi:hypothetical protein